MRKVVIAFVMLLLALTFIGPVIAQVSPHFDLSWNLLAGGGGSRVSANYQIDDALGQWPDGSPSSTHYQIDPGFWHVGRKADELRLYLPLILNPDMDQAK
jgi:hypothetical protein